MILPPGVLAAISPFEGIFVSCKLFTAAASQACDEPLTPGFAFMALEKGKLEAAPFVTWQLMHRLALPFRLVSDIPGEVCVI